MRLRLTAVAAVLAMVASCGGSGEPGPPAAPGSPVPAPDGPAATSPAPVSPAPVSPAPTSTPPAPRTLTSRDDGAVVRLEPGQTMKLVLRDPLAPDPVVDGNAITLIEVSNVTASGVREWEVQAVEAGTSEVRAEELGTSFTFRVEVG